MTRTICTSQCTAFHKLGFYLQGDVEWNLVAFIILQHPVCPHQTSNILIKHLIMYVIYSDNRWGEKNLFKAARSKHVCLCSSLDYLKQVMHLSGSEKWGDWLSIISCSLSEEPVKVCQGSESWHFCSLCINCDMFGGLQITRLSMQTLFPGPALPWECRGHVWTVTEACNDSYNWGEKRVKEVSRGREVRNVLEMNHRSSEYTVPVFKNSLKTCTADSERLESARQTGTHKVHERWWKDAKIKTRITS